jgi:hypothetical protein
MLDPVSIGGIALALAIAWWQSRDAARAKVELKNAMQTIPDSVATALRAIVSARNKDVKENPQNNAGWPMDIEYADVDGDGRNELLVQYPAGAHGSNLKVFGWKQGEFTEIAWLGVGTPVGFDFGDFDGDGKIEIKTEETDWSSGLCYAEAPRIVLMYRWNGTEFEEFLQKKKPAPSQQSA